MPQAEAHREQAEFNEQAANDVELKYPEWAVTMYFYAALHWVEWYAKNKGDELPPGSSPHDRRRNYIYNLANKLKNKDLRKAYDQLQRDSQTARYLENIKTNSRIHFDSHDRSKVSKSLSNLQIVKQLLVK